VKKLKYTVERCVCCCGEYSGPSPYPFCDLCFWGEVQDAGSGSDSRTGISVRRAPASAVDAMRLGLRRLAHQPRDARALHKMPEAAGTLRPRGPMRELASKSADGPPGAANGPRGCGCPCAGCGAGLTARRIRARFTVCPKRPGALPQVNSLDRREKLESQGGTPAGAADEMRPGVAAPSLQRSICVRISRYAQSGRRPPRTGTAGERSHDGGAFAVCSWAAFVRWTGWLHPIAHNKGQHCTVGFLTHILKLP
jgi:hypothetical protein